MKNYDNIDKIISEAIAMESGTLFTICDCPSYNTLNSEEKKCAARRLTKVMSEGWADTLPSKVNGKNQYKRN